MPINPKTAFCDSFPWNIDISFLDLTGLYEIDKERIAKIELDDNNYCDHYSQFIVKIIHKKNGAIDQKTFKFNDYFNQNGCQIIGHCGWEWYLRTPQGQDLINLVGSIEEYIAFYR